MSEFPPDQLRIQQIANSRYQNHSIIQRICSPRPNLNLIDFEQFNEAKRHKLVSFQVNQFRIGQMIDHLVVNETNYLINEINNHSTKRDTQEDIRQSIQDAVTELFTNGFDPCSIIVPRGLLVDIRIWNNEINPNEDSPRTVLNLGLGSPLNVAMPTQNVELNQIMILSKQSNNWDFIPRENNSPLQIEFELTKTEIAFWFREQCRFTNDENDGIISLNLPIEQII